MDYSILREVLLPNEQENTRMNSCYLHLEDAFQVR